MTRVEVAIQYGSKWVGNVESQSKRVFSTSPNMLSWVDQHGKTLLFFVSKLDNYKRR